MALTGFYYSELWAFDNGGVGATESATINAQQAKMPIVGVLVVGAPSSGSIRDIARSKELAIPPHARSRFALWCRRACVSA
jgi:hypothetical protein